MPTKHARVLVGRPFLTEDLPTDEATWLPLERVAYLSRVTSDLPAFHEGEFMYMGAVQNRRKKLRIHLFKHYDTRRYLNLDDSGHAYSFLPPDLHGPLERGHYQRYRSVVGAVDALGLWYFDAAPPLYRSFPPEAWPPEISPEKSSISG